MSSFCVTMVSLLGNRVSVKLTSLPQTSLSMLTRMGGGHGRISWYTGKGLQLVLVRNVIDIY